MAVKKSTKKTTVKKTAAASKKKTSKKTRVQTASSAQEEELTVMDPLSIEHALDPVSPKKVHATEEQIQYANWLDVGMKIGFVALIISYVFYVLGIIPPQVSLDELPKVWGLSVHDYLAATGAPDGRQWYAYLNKGDYMNFIGIAILSGITIIAYARIVPIFLAKKDAVYTAIAITEIAILGAAASGLITGGGH